MSPTQVSLTQNLYSTHTSQQQEAEFLKITRANNFENIKVLPFAERSWSNEFDKAIGSDLNLAFVSYMIMMIYLSSLLGEFPCVNCLDSRVSIALVSVLSVGLAIACSIGVASVMGFFYAPLHAALPFVRDVRARSARISIISLFHVSITLQEYQSHRSLTPQEKH